MRQKVKYLFVRACKSKNPMKRLKSLHRRFYLTDEKDTLEGISMCLSEICTCYSLTDPYTLMNKFTRYNIFLFFSGKSTVTLEDIEYYKVVILTSIVRLSSPEKFPNFTPPARYRNSK